MCSRQFILNERRFAVAKLKPEEKEMLHIVLDFAGSDENRIRDGIDKAIWDTKDSALRVPARRTYLRNILTAAAKAKMHYLAQRKKIAA